jgi:2'-5' RNA ligase
MPPSLFFIAIIVPEPVSSEITALKTDLSLRFNSKAALRSVPHLTLKSPFKISTGDVPQLLDWFANLKLNIEPFEVTLRNMGTFAKLKAPVIFINVERTETLQRLQRQVLRHFVAVFPDYKPDTFEAEFHPHITLAYRDLLQPAYKLAWHEYRHKKFDVHFEIDFIYLLRHDGKQWNIAGASALEKKAG